MKDLKERIREGLETAVDVFMSYWSLFLIGGILAVCFIFFNSQNQQAEKLTDEIGTKQELVANSQATLNGIKSFDKKPYKKDIEESTVSAKGIGERLIEIDNKLTAFYKQTDEPTDKELQEIEDVKDENHKLTGADKGDHIKTWQLNPDWSLKLETVINYRGVDSMPIVFSMETADGKNAGVVQAQYKVDENKITNVVKHYTQAGRHDEADVGGD